MHEDREHLLTPFMKRILLDHKLFDSKQKSFEHKSQITKNQQQVTDVAAHIMKRKRDTLYYYIKICCMRMSKEIVLSRTNHNQDTTTVLEPEKNEV